MSILRVLRAFFFSADFYSTELFLDSNWSTLG